MCLERRTMIVRITPRQLGSERYSFFLHHESIIPTIDQECNRELCKWLWSRLSDFLSPRHANTVCLLHGFCLFSRGSLASLFLRNLLPPLRFAIVSSSFPFFSFAQLLQLILGQGA